FPIPRFLQSFCERLRALTEQSAEAKECVGVAGILQEGRRQGRSPLLGSLPEEVVQRLGISLNPLVERRKRNGHDSPRPRIGWRAHKLRGEPLGDLTDFVRHDLGRLRRQAEEGEEVPAAPRVRPEAALELSEGVLILEERDHDALRRGMLALCKPRLAAARCGPDGGRVALEDPKPLALLPLLESEPSESQEHAEATRVRSHRICGDRQLYARPESSAGTCSAGRTSGESPKNARSAAPTRCTSSSTPTATIRSSTTSVRSATSAGTRASRTGTSLRPGGTTLPRSEPPGGRRCPRSSSARSGSAGTSPALVRSAPKRNGAS